MKTPILCLLSTLVATPLLTAQSSRGYADFDGSGERAIIPASSAPNLANQSFSIQFWSRRDERSATGWILGQGTNSQGLAIGYRSDNKFHFGFGESVLAASTSADDHGRWVHWTVTYTVGKTTRRIFRNGVQVASQRGVNPFTGSGVMEIADTPQHNDRFGGALDSLRIWKRALTGDEIARHYHRDLDPDERADSDLLAEYRFDGLSDLRVGRGGVNDLTDTSSHQRHADTVGAPTMRPWLPTFDPNLPPDAEIVVTNTNQSGPGSLADAIQTAQEQDDPNAVVRIDLTAVTGTIVVRTPFSITRRLVIEGPGAEFLALDAQFSTRHFLIQEGAGLALRDLRLRRGIAEGADGGLADGGQPALGGAIYVSPGAHLDAQHVHFEANEARAGDGGAPRETRAGKGGAGGFWIEIETGTFPPVIWRNVDATPGLSADGNSGGSAGAFPEGDGKNGGSGDPGAAGAPFAGGRNGTAGGGGGGGATSNDARRAGGKGGSGGRGGNGGRGGYAAGGGGGGPGGGGGGAGSGRRGETPHGSRGTAGGGGSGGSPGLGAGRGGNGLAGSNGQTGGSAHPDRAFNGGQGGARSGGGGGGAGMGGAIFAEPHATLKLNHVLFLRNRAQGGTGGTGANHGHGVGPAFHLMDGAYLDPERRGVSFLENRAVRGDGGTSAFPSAVFGADLGTAFEIRSGSASGLTLSLYYYEAEDRAEGLSNNAVFRYKWLLFAHDGSEPAFQFALEAPLGGTPNDPDAFGLFTPADEAAANAARLAALDAHQANPLDPDLRELVLDICHDTAAVQGFLAEFAANQAERNGRILDPAVQATLDQQIDAYLNPDGVLDRFDRALACYGDLLADPGRFTMLLDDQPLRDFEPLFFIADDGNENTTDPLAPVVTVERGNGYRDLTLLFDLLGAYGEAARELAELHLARDRAGDRQLGVEIAAEIQRVLFVHGGILQPHLPESSPAQLANAVTRWSGALDDLASVQARIGSGINSLGFPDDFLLLVSGGPQTDSYDFLYEETDLDFLATAELELALGLTAYNDYVGKQGQFEARREDLQNAINERLIEIEFEISDQFLRIENAGHGMELNSIDISNLEEEIVIKIETNEALKANNIQVAEIKVKYINENQRLEDIMSRNGVVGELTSAVGAAAGAFVAGGPAGAAAGLVKGYMNWLQSYSEAIMDQMKAELAASEQMELTDAANQRLDIELEGCIKRRLLDMNRYAVEALIAANVFRQELIRLEALISEKRRLERRLNTLDESLAARLFGDPLHQLRTLEAIGRADLAYRRARQWTFLTMRALEYKWNEDFVFNDTVAPFRTWTRNDLFAARNARDLRDLMDAMDQFDFLRTISRDLNLNNYTTFSVRQEFLEFADGTSAIDPVTGQSTTPIAAFRSRLAQLRDDTAGSLDGQIAIPFHTVVQKNGFFNGALYSSDGEGGFTLLDPGLALDKIDWVKVVLKGNFGGRFEGLGNNAQGGASLDYGGTSYVRRVEVGTLEDPDDPSAPIRPDRLFNELIPFETRTFDLTASTFPPPSSSGFLRDSVAALIADTSMHGDPLEVSYVQDDDDGFANTLFADRSVAATDWLLRLVVIDTFEFPIEQLDDILIIIKHRNYDRTFPSN